MTTTDTTNRFFLFILYLSLSLSLFLSVCLSLSLAHSLSFCEPQYCIYLLISFYIAFH